MTTGKRRVNGYKFPILKPTELVQCLSQLGACNPNITLDELEEPQHCKEKIRQTFLFLVSLVYALRHKPDEGIGSFFGNIDDGWTSANKVLCFLTSTTAELLRWKR